MIATHTGLPRFGKSYAALIAIMEELCRGKLTVFHNLEINHGLLAALAKERGFEPDFAERLHKIPEDRVRDFWEYATEKGYPNSRFFVIDEAHIYFDAYAWAEMGTQMSVYLTQHGHLNDQILFITQHLDMVAKRIRLLIARTTQFRNLKSERWLQFFRPPAWMVWTEFYGTPKHGQKPDAIGKRKIDTKLAGCYKTSVGHGGLGAYGKPEEERASRKLKWYWIAVPAALLLWGVAYGPELLVRLTVGKGMSALGGDKHKVDPGQLPKVTDTYTVPHPEPKQTQHHAAPLPPATKEPAGVVLRATGVLYKDGKMLIQISDGRVLTEQDKPYRKAGYVYWSDGEERAILNR